MGLLAAYSWATVISIGLITLFIGVVIWRNSVIRRRGLIVQYTDAEAKDKWKSLIDRFLQDESVGLLFVREVESDTEFIKWRGMAFRYNGRLYTAAHCVVQEELRYAKYRRKKQKKIASEEFVYVPLSAVQPNISLSRLKRCAFEKGAISEKVWRAVPGRDIAWIEMDEHVDEVAQDTSIPQQIIEIMTMWVSVTKQKLYIGTGKKNSPRWRPHSFLYFLLESLLWKLRLRIAHRYPNRWQRLLRKLSPHDGKGFGEYEYYQRHVVSRPGSSGSPGFIQDERTGAYAVVGVTVAGLNSDRGRCIGLLLDEDPASNSPS